MPKTTKNSFPKITIRMFWKKQPKSQWFTYKMHKIVRNELYLLGRRMQSGGHEDPGRSEIEGFRRELMRRETNHWIQTQSHPLFLHNKRFDIGFAYVFCLSQTTKSQAIGKSTRAERKSGTERSYRRTETRLYRQRKGNPPIKIDPALETAIHFPVNYNNTIMCLYYSRLLLCLLNMW